MSAITNKHTRNYCTTQPLECFVLDEFLSDFVLSALLALLLLCAEEAVEALCGALTSCDCLESACVEARGVATVSYAHELQH